MNGMRPIGIILSSNPTRDENNDVQNCKLIYNLTNQS
jgi:hypothetical protein